MQRRVLIQMLLWAAVISWMALIFAFSAQPGAESDALSGVAAMPIAELLASMKEGADAQTAEAMYLITGTLIRKTAHLCEYALLGLLLALLCRSYGRSAHWLPILAGVAYAATDEWHQTFVPGRLGAPVDVLIDAVGVIGGVWAAGMIHKIWRKKHVYDQ